jgi:hypothetical protein
MSRTFELKIELDNDAFADGQEGRELNRILEEVAAKVRDGLGEHGTGGKIRDINGQTVGEFVVYGDLDNDDEPSNAFGRR